MRILAWICVLLFTVVFLVPVFTSCDEDTGEHTEYISDTDSILETTVSIETQFPEPSHTLVDFPETPTYPDIDDLLTIYDVEKAIQLCDNFLMELEAITLRPPVEHPQTGELVALRETAQDYKSRYETILSDHWLRRKQARPVTTEIWLHLSDTVGFNHAVVAGILGNMCAESGDCGYGDIQVYNWDNKTGRSYYGVCQWSVRYYPEIAYTDLKFQLEYLVATYDYEFTHWGYNYSNRYGSKFGTEQFLSMKDPYEAAIAFAVCYERCSKEYVELRGHLADKTYEYFTVLGSWPWPETEPVLNKEG